MHMGKVIGGLYAACEAARGSHSNNRLGGNSLLDCVILWVVVRFLWEFVSVVAQAALTL